MTLEELGKDLKRFFNFKYISLDQFAIKLYSKPPTYNSSYRSWSGSTVGYIDKSNLIEEIDLSKYKKAETPTGKIIPDYGKALEKV